MSQLGMTTVIFDTETTGLLQPMSVPLEKQPRIIEIGAIKIDHTGEIDHISQLINPGVEISDTITKITGIKQEDLTGMPSFLDVMPRLQEFFDGVDLIICHNAPFDTGMMQVEIQLSGKELIMPPQTICTVQEYKPLFGHRPKLTELYEAIIGKPLMQSHRAIDDVRALYEVLLEDEFFKQIEL